MFGGLCRLVVCCWGWWREGGRCGLGLELLRRGRGRLLGLLAVHFEDEVGEIEGWGGGCSLRVLGGCRGEEGDGLVLVGFLDVLVVDLTANLIG